MQISDKFLTTNCNAGSWRVPQSQIVYFMVIWNGIYDNHAKCFKRHQCYAFIEFPNVTPKKSLVLYKDLQDFVCTCKHFQSLPDRHSHSIFEFNTKLRSECQKLQCLSVCNSKLLTKEANLTSPSLIEMFLPGINKDWKARSLEIRGIIFFNVLVVSSWSTNEIRKYKLKSFACSIMQIM